MGEARTDRGTLPWLVASNDPRRMMPEGTRCPTITEQPSDPVMQFSGVAVVTIERRRPCFAC